MGCLRIEDAIILGIGGPDVKELASQLKSFFPQSSIVLESKWGPGFQAGLPFISSLALGKLFKISVPSVEGTIQKD